MKQSKLVSMIGALVVMISAVVCITACPQANGNKNKKENTTINNGGTTGTTDNSKNPSNSDNSDGSLEVTPTGKAVPALAGTSWKKDTNDVTKIDFDKKGNIAAIFGLLMLYIPSRIQKYLLIYPHGLPSIKP